MAANLNVAIDIIANDLSGGAFNTLFGNVVGVASALTRLGGIAGGLSDEVLMLGGAAIGAGLAFAGFAAIASQAVSAGEDLQYALAKLEVATQASADQFPLLQSAIIDMATHSFYSTTDAAQAFSEMIQKGFSVKDVLYGIKAADDSINDPFNSTLALQGLGRQAMALGEVMGTDATTGADLLASALQIFNKSDLDAADAANILTGAFYNGVPSAAALQQAIEAGGARANAAGVQFKDFAATLVLLGQAGMDGYQAGSSLQYMITNLTHPTSVAAKALAELGIVTVNKTSPAFKEFTKQLKDSGAAGAAAVKGYDGSVTGLQNLFSAAQGAGLISLDKTFNNWADSLGLLNNKLFDSKGNFTGIEGSLIQLDEAMDKAHMTQQDKLDEIASLFNVRSGRAAQILLNIDQLKAAYNKALKDVGSQNALQDALKMLDTFKGSITEIGTSISSSLALIAQPFLAAVTPILQKANDLVGKFNDAGAAVHGFVGAIIGIGLVASGLAVVVIGVAALVAIFIALGSILAPVALGFVVILGIIGGVIAQVLLFVAAIRSNTTLMHAWSAVTSFIGTLFGVLGNVLGMLGSTLGQLAPIWNILKIAFMAVAIVVGAVLVAAFILVIGIIIAVVFVLNLIIQVLIHIVQAVASFVGGVLGWFGELPGRIGQVWSHIQQGAASAWKAIQGAIQLVLSVIGSIFTGAWNDIVQGVQRAISQVVGWFKWLYDHNYYFQELVDFVRQKWADFQSMLAGLRSWVIAAWTGLWSQVEARIHVAYAVLMAVWSAVQLGAQTIWNSISNTARSVWNTIVSTVQTAATNAKNEVLGALHALSSLVGGVMNTVKTNILNPILGVASSLYNAGKNAMHMLAQGILDAAGAVGNAVMGVSKNIAGMLGFHSPPPEGPLSDSDTYMPNMMRMFASDIQGHIGLVQSAAASVATTLANGVTPRSSQLAAAVPIGGASQPGNLAVQIDGQTLVNIMYQIVNGHLAVNGMNRQWR